MKKWQADQRCTSYGLESINSQIHEGGQREENKWHDLLKARWLEGNLLVLGNHHGVTQLESTVSRNAQPKIFLSFDFPQKYSVLKIAVVLDVLLL